MSIDPAENVPPPCSCTCHLVALNPAGEPWPAAVRAAHQRTANAALLLAVTGSVSWTALAQLWPVPTCPACLRAGIAHTATLAGAYLAGHGHLDAAETHFRERAHRYAGLDHRGSIVDLP